MTEIATVITADVKNATVRILKKSACENCGMCGFKKKDTHLDLCLDNAIGAKVGDRVLLEMPTAFVLKAAAIVYLIPLFTAIIGLILTVLLHLKETFQFIACVAGLIIGAVIVAFFDKKAKRKGFCPKILKIIEKKQEEI